MKTFKEFIKFENENIYDQREIELNYDFLNDYKIPRDFTIEDYINIPFDKAEETRLNLFFGDLIKIQNNCYPFKKKINQFGKLKININAYLKKLKNKDEEIIYFCEMDINIKTLLHLDYSDISSAKHYKFLFKTLKEFFIFMKNFDNL